MPKVFKYDIDDELYVKGTPDSGNKVKVIEQLTTSQYDYRCKFENGEETKFYESELIICNFEISQFVRVKSSGEVGQIEIVDEENEQLEVEFLDGSMDVYGFDQVEHYRHEGNGEEMVINEEEIDVVDHLLETLLSQYKNENGTYTVPELLLKNMLSKLYDEE